MTAGLLTTIRESWAAFLAADAANQPCGAFFTPAPPALPIPIFTEKLGALQQRIDEGLMKTGLSILIRTAQARKARNQIAGHLAFEKISAIARVVATPDVNPLNLAASDVAERIAWDTQNFHTCGEPMQLQAITLASSSTPGQVTYEVLYTIDGRSSEVPTR